MKPFKLLLCLVYMLGGCSPQPPLISDQHLSQTPPVFLPPPPKPALTIKPIDEQLKLRQQFSKKHSFSIKDLPIQALLTVFMQESPHNIVVDSYLTGVVSVKVEAQTLPDILDLLAQQVSLRYHFKKDTIIIQADTPYIKSYTLDYLNIERETRSETAITTQVSANAQSEVQSNNSRTQIRNEFQHQFWQNLQQSLQTVLNTDDADFADNVSLLAEVGVLSIRATDKQHKQIKQLLDLIQQSAHRQVLIEATIAEVQLNQQHQAGIDWQSLGKYLGGTQKITDVGLNQLPFFALTYQNKLANTDIYVALKLLQQFGTVNILSSPKILALNNQTALLRVVDNRVYFTVDIEITNETKTTSSKETYTTHVNTVPEGLIMQVTPQISADKHVMLNIRPSISRIIGFVNDPNPNLAKVGVKNPIPEIQVREIETVLRVAHNTVVVIGGLMQDKQDEHSAGVPVLSQLPDIGALFRYDNQQYKKTELVLFLRPVVVD